MGGQEATAQAERSEAPIFGRRTVASDSDGLWASDDLLHLHAWRLRQLSLWCAVAVAVGSMIDLVGRSWLMSSLSLAIEMDLPALLASLAVISFHFRRKVGLGVARALSVLAFATLMVSFVFGGFPAVHLGAFSVLLLVTSGYLLMRTERLARAAADWLTVTAISIAGVALLARLFRIDDVEGVQRFVMISPLTAAGLMVFGVAVLCSDTEWGIARALSQPNAAGRMLRWFLPSALVGTLALGLVIGMARDAQLFSRSFALPLFVALEMLALSFLIWRSAVQLQEIDDERAEATRGLRRAKDELEARVARRTAELQKLNGELESFSYSISHDLRAPLRAIAGFSQILQDEYGPRLDDEAKRYLGIIRTNTETMGDLISDLLAFSRVSRQEVRTTTVDMSRLTQELVAAAAARLGKTVEFELEALPPAQADPAMTKQVVENLVSNAIKYSERKPGGTIRLRGERGEKFNRYLIEDQGVGFDSRYAGKLFGVFQRLHGDEFEGTGVGLSIVKRIVEKHGGEVGAESQLGEGATFWFTLPAADARPERDETSEGEKERR
ncbi:MAG: hypothetical protein KY459_05510 [Acidobacteria bacterium]|nr:hypothetical protein [Acidobacteriota bacterium]